MALFYAQKPAINGPSMMLTYPEDSDLNFGQSLHLHPYFVYVSSEGSGESAHFVTFCADSPDPLMLTNVIL